MNAMTETGIQPVGEFRTSIEIGALAEALARATAEFSTVGKDREVSVKSERGAYKFSYATLSEIMDATRPALAKNGLVVVQMPATVGNRLLLVTRLMHASGQWMEGAVTVPAGGKMQELGSALTYLRRYAYSAALGIVASEDDDDGNAADGNHAEWRDRQPPRGQNAPPPRQVAEEWKLLGPDAKVYPISAKDGQTAIERWLEKAKAVIEKMESPAALTGWEKAMEPHLKAVEARHPQVVAAARLAAKMRFVDAAA